MSFDNRSARRHGSSAPPRLAAPLRISAALCLAFALSAFGTLPRNAVPAQKTLTAFIPDMPDIRAWAGQASPFMERDLILSFQQESAGDLPRAADGSVRYAHLALLGGGWDTLPPGRRAEP